MGDVIQVDEARCRGCGVCGHVCARRILEPMERGGAKKATVCTERESICIRCGQCMAVCPNEALRVDGIAPHECHPVPKIAVNHQQLIHIMAHRRSVRRYKDEPVPREVLNQIVEAVHWAPTAASRGSTGVIVVDRKELLEELSQHFYRLYERVEKALGNPVGRFFFARSAGSRNFEMLQNFVMPGMRWYMQWYREGTSNEIIRDCPVLMLFHAPTDEPSGEENCVIAAWHAVLMAEVLGVGTCFNGLVPPPCNKLPEVRALLRLPADREVYASLTLGYPKYKFRRTIRRNLFETRYLD